MKKVLFVITALLLYLSGYSQKFVRIESQDIFVEVENVYKYIDEDEVEAMAVIESTDGKLYIVPKRFVWNAFRVSLHPQSFCVRGSVQLEKYFRKYEYNNNEPITKLEKSTRTSGALYVASDIGIILSAGILGIMPITLPVVLVGPGAFIVPAAIIGTTALILRISGDVKLMKNE